MKLILLVLLFSLGSCGKPQQRQVPTSKPAPVVDHGWDEVQWQMDFLNLQIDGTTAILECSQDELNGHAHSSACRRMCEMVEKRNTMLRNKPDYVHLGHKASQEIKVEGCP